MSKHLFKINVSNSKYESIDDSIKIQITKDEDITVNFSKFVGQSKYVLDNYKYSEALYSIPKEIKKISEEFKISSASLKYFFQLIQTEEINAPVEYYKDIYTLSEYFCIPKFISELDKIREEEISKDLNFSIQILHDLETSNDRLETKLTTKIENFLREHINECIENDKFKELPVSTVFRILELCEKGSVNSNSLFEFIVESATTRFILLKFVELHKLTDDQIENFIKFIEKQDEKTKEVYLECMPVSLSFIKYMKNKNDQLLNELKMTKEKMNEMNEEIGQEKIKHNQTKGKINEMEKEIELEKIKHNQTKEKLDKYKNDLKQAEDEINQSKIENILKTQAVIVGGNDSNFVLGEKPNNISTDDTPSISPPVKSQLNPSSLLSFSSYCWHSVAVTRNGSLMGVGNNECGQICSSLSKSVIDHFTEFSIKDSSGRKLVPVSAVCYLNGTLYMFSKSNGGRQLVLCDEEINEGTPIFLDIGNHEPVSLFGGHSHSAAIGVKGEVIFINRYSVKNSPSSRIEAVSLPGGEKASSVACLNDSVFVLSSNGRFFESSIQNDLEEDDEEENKILSFSIVSELLDKEIISLSGKDDHCLAVSKDGCVFGRGSNDYGQLGLGHEIESASSFKEISSLRGYKIRAAYAGCCFSLFETREGKIFSCGHNTFGQLLLSSGPSEYVYSPTETTITNGATFCIAGDGLSAVFIGTDPPPNTPNKRI